jgi:hypothetical protein
MDKRVEFSERRFRGPGPENEHKEKRRNNLTGARPPTPWQPSTLQPAPRDNPGTLYPAGSPR